MPFCFNYSKLTGCKETFNNVFYTSSCHHHLPPGGLPSKEKTLQFDIQLSRPKNLSNIWNYRNIQEEESGRYKSLFYYIRHCKLSPSPCFSRIFGSFSGVQREIWSNISYVDWSRVGNFHRGSSDFRDTAFQSEVYQQTLTLQYDQILRDGLLLSTGPKWHSRRKITAAAFHYKILEGFVDVFDRNSHILAKKFKKHLDGNEFDIYWDVSLAALDIICGKTLFICFDLF